MSLKEGELLAGKYELHDQIGEGGMSTVFEATDTTLGRKVAIKFVRHSGDAHSQERLRREAVAVAQLHSEHIVNVFETGFTETEGLFLVMERLQGSDVRQQLDDRRRLTLRESVYYILQVCEALAHAHAAKIVHRDIKPSNMFIAREASGRHTLKLLDFGIARNRGADQESNLTRDSLLGSPSFMSPEQIRSSKDVDARSDIWSLGVCLFQMLCGQLPFPGDNLGVIATNICEAATPSLASRKATVPVEVEACIQRCLRKSPQNRYQSVLELAEALAPFGDKEECRGLLASMQHVVVGAMAAEVSGAETREVPPHAPSAEQTIRDAPPTEPPASSQVEETLLDAPPSLERLRAMATSQSVESTVPMAGEKERAARALAAKLQAAPREHTKPIPVTSPQPLPSGRPEAQAPTYDTYARDVADFPDPSAMSPSSSRTLRWIVVAAVLGLALAVIAMAIIAALFAS